MYRNLCAAVFVALAFCACVAQDSSSSRQFAQVDSTRTSDTKPKSAEDYLEIGQRLLAQPGRSISAHEAFKKAFQLADDKRLQARALVGIGEFWHRSAEYPRAIGYYNRAIAIDPKCADAFMHLGVAIYAKDRRNPDYQSEAMDLLSRARSLDPAFGDAIAWQGLIHHARGKIGDAVFCYESALNLRLSRSLKGDVLKELGRAYLQSAQFEEALTTFLRLKREFPDYDGPDLREQIKKTRELIKLRDKGKRIVEGG